MSRGKSLVVTDDLSPEVVLTLREASERIRVRIQRTAADIVEIGRDLILIKEKVGHGNFLPWIDREFGMSEWTARNFMRVAETFGSKSGTLPDLPPTVLYELAAPSTPQEVRDNVVEMAQRGEKVTTKTVAELKEKLKEAERALKNEREIRANIEARSREVMAERDTAQQQNLMLQSQVRQLAEARPVPEDDEPELIPPSVVDPNLVSLLAIWRQSGPATREAFLSEIGEH